MDLSRLSGIGISGFRSFGTEEMQFLTGMAKMNFVAGQNNSGKSNVLRALTQLVTKPSLQKFDRYGSSEEVTICISIRLDPDQWRPALESKGASGPQLEAMGAALDLHQDGGIWIPFTLNQRVELNDRELSEAVARLGGARQQIRNLSMQVAGQGGGSPNDDIKRVVEALRPLEHLPKVELIPAFRQIRTDVAGSMDEEMTVDGKGVVQGLHRLKNPTLDHREDKKKFASVERFLRDVLEDDAVDIEIPHDQRDINVVRNEMALPLSSCGTGVEQVIILAAAAAITPNSMLMMEEPEAHLHPRLQRKLIRYLDRETDNQYLIATHSAQLLDFPLGSIYHLRASDTGTQVTSAIQANERSDLCSDLGYQTSDLMQTTAIIWVEGPSDRIHLKHWIEKLDPDLREQVEYSIMFFGGALMSHLTSEDLDPNDPLIDDFISLRKLNRHMTIVFDSDRTAENDDLNATKRRLLEELADSEHQGWVTWGYTIENYVPAETLRAAVSAVHPSATPNCNGDRFTNPLKDLGVAKPSKADIARHAVAEWRDASGMSGDLGERVRDLVAFIRRANE